MLAGDFEKPVGEWNNVDLYAVGDRSLHVVNGKVALVLTGLRQKVDGKEVPLTKGRIELQTESAEIFFRNIQIQQITEIPKELLK
jgi:3-keto-disaccharide hydrolase